MRFVSEDHSGYFRRSLAALEAGKHVQIEIPLADSLKDAEAVVIEVDIRQLEAKFSAMIPEFARGAVVHVQSHGYWPAARLTPHLRRAGRGDVLVTEAPAPTHAARITGTVVTPKGLRKGIRIATAPAARANEALAVLKPLFPDFEAATSVMQTGLENLNLIVHPAMVLPNVGAMERAKLDEIGRAHA